MLVTAFAAMSELSIARSAIFAVVTALFAISAFTIKGDGPFPPNTLSVTFPVISAFGNHVAMRSPPFCIAIAASVVVCIAVGISSCQ